MGLERHRKSRLRRYTKHDYLKRLSDLLAEHGRKSGADLKMLLDPSMKSLMERRNKEGV